MPINPYEPPKEEGEPLARKGQFTLDRRIVVLGIATFLSLSWLGWFLVLFVIQPSPLGLAPLLIGILLNVPTAIWWWIWYASSR